MLVTPPAPPSTAPPSITDNAIELFNPYPVALSLNGFGLRYKSGTTAGVDYPFATTDFVPAYGYFVLRLGTIGDPIPGTAKSKTDAAFALTSQNTVIYLMRQYFPRGATAASWAAVDAYNLAALMKQVGTSMATSPTAYSVGRSNPAAATTPTPALPGGVWMASVETTLSESSVNTNGATLGGPNPAISDDTISTQAPPLWDYVGMNQQGGEVECLNNIADFNHIMRICNVIDTSSGGLPFSGAGAGTVSQELNTLITNPDTNNTNTGSFSLTNTVLKVDAAIHFDFAAPPHMYGRLTGTGTAANPFVVPALPITPNYETFYVSKGAPTPGDPRAVNLLESLAFTDRVSDNLITMGDEGRASPAGGPNGSSLSKLRIPGRINVNTAPAEVLATIPAFSNTNLFGANAPGYIGVILAYRWRTTNNDPRIPSWASKIPADFTNAIAYPGYGIHSMAELNIPLIIAQEQLGVWGPPGTAPPTLDARDALWADIFNYLTVRSDTFVVYGYLEAVKQNPRYANIFNNTTDWYTTNAPISIIDDPNDSAHATTAALIRVARKRWVAIVDRSQCNYNLGDPRNVKPRIIAIRDLPQ